MQPNRTVDKTLKMSVVFVALLGGLVLGGCDRQQKTPPPRPAPEVSVVTMHNV